MKSRVYLPYFLLGVWTNMLKSKCEACVYLHFAKNMYSRMYLHFFPLKSNKKYPNPDQLTLQI